MICEWTLHIGYGMTTYQLYGKGNQGFNSCRMTCTFSFLYPPTTRVFIQRQHLSSERVTLRLSTTSTDIAYICRMRTSRRPTTKEFP